MEDEELKKIQEIHEIISEYCENHENDPYFYGCCLCDSEIMQMAGFCHFSIDKIMQEIGNIEVGRDSNYNIVYARDLTWYKTVCKKYGVKINT